jgi:acyl carrier protein
MVNELVLDRVISVLAEYTSARVAIPSGSHFLVEDLGIDSLEMLAAITSLEAEFGIRIPDDIMSEISTVGELSEFIAARLSLLRNQS